MEAESSEATVTFPSWVALCSCLSSFSLFPFYQDMVQMSLSGDSLCLETLGAISWRLGGAVTFGCV